MLSTSVRAAAWLSRSIVLFCAVLIGSSPSSAASSSRPNPTDQTSTPTTTVQSDAAAVQAIANVIAQSGGAAAWQALRSVEETFSVLRAGQTTAEVHLLLDDWSLDSTRYRRRVKGKNITPRDHNGQTTFNVKLGPSQFVTTEYDQARTLVARLPAAAAAVMLRRTEYVLKTPTSRPCESGNICVDVYRSSGGSLPLVPEQRWKIAAATGLPVSVSIEMPNFGHPSKPLWKEVHYVQFAANSGLLIPVSTAVTTLGGKQEQWTFVSLKPNPGFDTSAFDQEVAQ